MKYQAPDVLVGYYAKTLRVSSPLVYFYFMVASSWSSIISFIFQTVIHKLYKHIFKIGDVIVEIEGEDADQKNHSQLVDAIKTSKQELK